MNATNIIVAGKLEPIGKADAAPVALVTGQGFYELHGKPYVLAVRKAEAGKCERIRKAAQEGVRCFEARGSAGIAEFSDALSDAVAILADVAKKQPDNARAKSDANILAVFASNVRTVVGVLTQGRAEFLPCKLSDFSNTDDMLRECRKALQAKPTAKPQALPHIDWKGAEVLHGDAKVQSQLRKATARQAAKAAEQAILSGMQPDAAADLLAKATATARTDAAAEMLAKAAEAGAKYGDHLAQARGADAAEAFLTAALAKVRAIAAAKAAK
jgi:hypothetical protein